jgi:hypothetical protein
MSDFGPNQVALGLFFDHSGQDLFKEPAPSLLNTTGLGVEYAPWPWLAVGAFGGAAEFDVDVPDGKEGDTAFKGYDGNYSFYGGGTLKLATPRFASGTTRFVAQASAAYLNSEDENENAKKGFMTNSGVTLQSLAWGRLNFVVGAEFQALLEGEQTSSVTKDPEPFGVSATGPIDYVRGILGIEYYFKGANKPFVSLSFRPNGAIGWHDHLGLRNASIAVTLGAMATLPAKGKNQINEEEPGLAED